MPEPTNHTLLEHVEMNTKDLIATLRKDAALCLAIRNAAQREADVTKDVAAALGAQNRNQRAIDAHLERLKDAREELVDALRKYEARIPSEKAAA